jgi:hypothetical protein
MVEIGQVVRWLKDSGEGEAAELAKSCSLNWIWATLGSEVYGDRDYDMWDVSIEAPAQVLRAVRGDKDSLATTIEAAVRDLGEGNIARSLRWVPKVSPVSRVSEQEITEVTRREIVDILSTRNWAGRLSETELGFL